MIRSQYIGWFEETSRYSPAYGLNSVCFDTMEDLRAWESRYGI